MCEFGPEPAKKTCPRPMSRTPHKFASSLIAGTLAAFRLTPNWVMYRGQTRKKGSAEKWPRVTRLRKRAAPRGAQCARTCSFVSNTHGRSRCEEHPLNCSRVRPRIWRAHAGARDVDTERPSGRVAQHAGGDMVVNLGPSVDHATLGRNSGRESRSGGPTIGSGSQKKILNSSDAAARVAKFWRASWVLHAAVIAASETNKRLLIWKHPI